MTKVSTPSDPTQSPMYRFPIVLHTELISYVSAIYLLIGISLLVAIGFLCAFLWAVRKEQFDDDYTPSVRMLFDDEIKKTQDNK
jgi:cbb3-type cytochrome oxidase maturation protein